MCAFKVRKSSWFCLEEDRGMLVVTVRLRTRSRTQTAPLWAQQLDCLPCRNSPDRRLPKQPNNAMPADTREGREINSYSGKYKKCLSSHTDTELLFLSESTSSANLDATCEEVLLNASIRPQMWVLWMQHWNRTPLCYLQQSPLNGD